MIKFFYDDDDDVYYMMILKSIVRTHIREKIIYRLKQTDATSVHAVSSS